jgi:hypothetical protein
MDGGPLQKFASRSINCSFVVWFLTILELDSVVLWASVGYAHMPTVHCIAPVGYILCFCVVLSYSFFINIINFPKIFSTFVAKIALQWHFHKIMVMLFVHQLLY